MHGRGRDGLQAQPVDATSQACYVHLLREALAGGARAVFCMIRQRIVQGKQHLHEPRDGRHSYH